MPTLSYGPVPQQRAAQLLSILLGFIHDPEPYKHLQSLKGAWKKSPLERSANQLVIQSTMADLERLTQSVQNNGAPLTKAQIRTALHQFEHYLGILEDHRVAAKQGNAQRHFTLTLWSKDAPENLQQFNSLWNAKRSESDTKPGKESAKEELNPTQVSPTLPATPPLWSAAPDITTFIGRTQELATLTQWVMGDRCRLISLCGMGGTGKSFLAAQLAQDLKEQFDYFLWQPIINAPSTQELLSHLVYVLSEQQAGSLSQSMDGLMKKLLGLLQRYRCLIVLDNVESVLKPGSRTGQYRADYEFYGHLFKQLGETSHQSTIILTCREQPYEVSLLQGEHTLVRSFLLKGLDVADGCQIIAQAGSFTGTDPEWQHVITLYNGHPLALKLTAHFIKTVFFGCISDFLKEGQIVFDGIEALLNWHFERLSHLEKEVMCWLALNRKPISRVCLKNDIISTEAQLALSSILSALIGRSLLERNQQQQTFYLQPVLVEYVTDKLIHTISHELNAGQFTTLKQYALLKGDTEDYIKDTQRRLVLIPIAERLTPVTQEKLATDYLDTLRQQAIPDQGYAPGNCLNLLCYLRRNYLAEIDCSKLGIYYADFRSAILHNTDFSQVHFIKPAFSQTFGCTYAVAFSPDGHYLALSDGHGDIHIWSLQDNQPYLTLKGHSRWVWTVAYSPDGKLIASGGDDNCIKLWDTQSGHCLSTIKGHQKTIFSVAFSPDGRMLASGGDDNITRLWRVSDSALMHTLEGHTNWIWSVAFSPDGTVLASSGDDTTIRLWDTHLGILIDTLRGHQFPVWSVAFSPNGRLLASGSADHTIKLWDLDCTDSSTTLKGHTCWVWSIAFTPDSKILISGSDDQTIKRWDVAQGIPVQTLQGHSSWIWSIAVSPDGRTIASGSDDQTVRLWNLETGECLRTIQGYKRRVSTLTFSSNPDILISGGSDTTLKYWHLPSGHCQKTLLGHHNRIWSTAIGQNGDLLASASEDESLILWNAHTGEQQQVLTQQYEGRNRMWAIACHSNGQLLASGEDQGVSLWDAHSGCLLRAC